MSQASPSYKDFFWSQVVKALFETNPADSNGWNRKTQDVSDDHRQACKHGENNVKAWREMAAQLQRPQQAWYCSLLCFVGVQARGTQVLRSMLRTICIIRRRHQYSAAKQIDRLNDGRRALSALSAAAAAGHERCCRSERLRCRLIKSRCQHETGL